MRKIAELSGDEFFDVIYALSPILPMIVDMEVVQAQLFRNYSDKVTKARAAMSSNTLLLAKNTRPEKAEEYQRKIDEANRAINAEISGMFARDVARVVPALSSKTNRGCLFETLSIVEGLPIDEVKKFPAPKLIAKIKRIVSDTDFKSFLSYADESEPTN